MKTKNPNPPADFEYAEFSGVMCCPFCGTKLYSSDEGSFEEFKERWESNPTGRDALSCEHVGLWSFGTISDPMLNENWRDEMFALSKTLTGNLTDDADGYHWQEALNFAIAENGNVGQAVALALPTHQVAVYKHFWDIPDGGRDSSYMAIILRKKRHPKAAELSATVSVDR